VRACVAEQKEAAKKSRLLFFLKYSTNANIYICISNYSYEYMHVHYTFITNFERLSQFDLEIHKVGHSRCRRKRRLPLKK
jgi:Fe-S cluster biosynthesis and repair protein YggX